MEAADDEGRRGQRAGALWVPRHHATNFVECLLLGALVSVMPDVPICLLRTGQLCGVPACAILNKVLHHLLHQSQKCRLLLFFYQSQKCDCLLFHRVSAPDRK